MACEEDVRKQRSRGGFRGKEVRTVVVVSSSVWVECLEQRSASSAFYWTHSTSALRTKATTKLTDESQMSRQSSKEASWPRTYTHTHYRLPLQRVERIETRICGRLECSSTCPMSVCGMDREEAWTDIRTPESYSVFMPVAINALTHSSSWAQASALTAGTMENKERLFYSGNFSFMWITLRFSAIV